MGDVIKRPISGYEGLYSVDTDGNIYSDRRGIILKSNNVGGYRQYSLQKNGKRKLLLGHVIVAKTFIPNPNDYPIVNHKDENKSNNNVKNLEWCTHSYNTNYGTCPEKMRKSHTLAGAIAVMRSVVQINGNGIVINEFESISEASRQTGVNLSCIAACCKGYKFRHTAGGYVWKFKEEE